MKLNIQLFATNLSVGGSYTQAWQEGNSVGGTAKAYKWRTVVNYISRDVIANTSYIRIRFQEYGTWGDYSGMNSTYSRLKISLNNGSTWSQLAYKKTPSYTKDEVETKLDVYYTVNHNANGSSPNIKIQASNETSNTASYAPADKTITSDTITLTTIPRGSKLGDIDDFAIATSTTIPISITKYVNTFTDNLVVSINGTTIKTVNGITNGYNLTFTSAEVANMKTKFTGSSTPVTFTLNTYNGSTLIGSSVVTATGIDASRVMGLSRYKSNTGYKYCVNGVLDKTLDDGLQIGGTLYVNGYDYSTVKTGNLSITKTSGSSNADGTYALCGKVMSINFHMTTTAAVASGNDLFVGKINNFNPAVVTCFAGYTGAKSVIASVGTDGSITVRNASSSSIAKNTSVSVRGTVIIE